MVLNITNTPIKNDVDEAVLAREVAQEMLNRLAWMTFKPERILLLETVVSGAAETLASYYPEATILTTLHGEQGGVDLIFANLVLPYVEAADTVLRDWRVHLRPEGVAMISAFGPDTLKECQTALYPQVVDMHNLGDGMMEAGFTDPVLEVDYYTISYACRHKLMNELVACKMLHDTGNLTEVIPFTPQIDERYALTFEIVYAHAFAPAEGEEEAETSSGEFRVSLASLRKQLNAHKK